MNTFNYYYWNTVISSKNIKDINSLIKKHRDKKENKNLAADTNKTSTVYPIKLKYLKDLLKIPMSLIIKGNRENYGYDVFDFYDEMVLNFNTYEKNQEYDWHKDADESKFVDLKLTALINVSDKNFTGGEFSLLSSKQPTSVPELDTPGSMIIFNSYILHKVNPVLNGIRKTLSIFITGPAFK